MAPVHRSDLDAERFEDSSWKDFELWEKLAERERRRNRFWIGGAVVLFLGLAAVPVVSERSRKWGALSAARWLALELGSAKTQASIEKSAVRLRWSPASIRGEGLSLEKSKVAQCALTGAWHSVAVPEHLRLTFKDYLPRVSTGFATEWCYDPRVANPHPEPMKLGVIHVKDLADASNGEEWGDTLGAFVAIQGPNSELLFQ